MMLFLGQESQADKSLPYYGLSLFTSLLYYQ